MINSFGNITACVHMHVLFRAHPPPIVHTLYHEFSLLESLSFFIQVQNKSSCLFVGAIAAYFGEGSGPVLGGISCRGTEHSATECSSEGSVGQLNCHHGRDVGVICQGRVGLSVV